jgi:tetratricopeptide (TPR) repeat protein
VDEVLIVRTAQLLLLALAPSMVSPEPSAPASLALSSLLALVGLIAAIAGAWRLRAVLRNREALVAAVLASGAGAAALACAALFSGAHAPLARGVPYVAPLAWAALALTAAAIARHARRRVRGQHLLAAALVLGVGAALHVDAAPLIGSRERMWWEAFRRDGDDPRPMAALAGPLVRARRFAEAMRVADRCAAQHPASCVCPALRADIELRSGALEVALADARAAVGACPTRGSAHALLAEVLSARGDVTDAEREVVRGLDLGSDTARLRYARAVTLERAQRYAEARVEVARAIADGAGRDAELFAAALAIVGGDLDDAAHRLEPLVAADAADADAQYDLALVDDGRNDYNRARQRYLTVLRLDPLHARARYNLAALTWRAGAADEARHHARKFLDAFPTDSRSAELAALVGIAR